jgi:hypothetical protein
LFVHQVLQVVWQLRYFRNINADGIGNARDFLEALHEVHPKVPDLPNQEFFRVISFVLAIWAKYVANALRC